MTPKPTKKIQQLTKHFKRNLWRGFIIILPLILTAYVVIILCSVMESFFAKILDGLGFPHYYFPGLGIILSTVLFYFFGIFTRRWIGRRCIALSEQFFEKIPILKSIYSISRDLINQFTMPKSKSGSQPVLVTFKSVGIQMVGFAISGEEALESIGSIKNSEELVLVYLPMGYQIGGYTLIVPRSIVSPINLSFEDTMRFVLTAGISSGKTASTESTKLK